MASVNEQPCKVHARHNVALVFSALNAKRNTPSQADRR